MDEQTKRERRRGDAGVSNDSRKFHMTIGHQIGDPSDIYLRDELQTAKIAALYADEATLISLKGKALEIIRSSTQGNIVDWDTTRLRTAMDGEVLDGLDDLDEAVRSLRQVRDEVSAIEKTRSRQTLRKDREYLKIKKFLNGAEPNLAPAKAQLQTVLDATGYSDLDKLVKLGIINFPPDDVIGIADKNVERFFSAIFDIFNKGSITYPLFDDATTDIVRLGIEAGKINPTAAEIQRTRQIYLPADFLSRLPNFPNASIDQIIQIRKLLRKHLVKFRAAMIAFSDEIDSAPWDKDFRHDVENLYNAKVAPAIAEIEEAIEDNSLAKHISKKVVTGATITGAVSVVVSRFDSLSSAIMDNKASLAGAGLAGAFSIYNDYQKEANKIKRNGLYFLYRAGKEIAKG